MVGPVVVPPSSGEQGGGVAPRSPTRFLDDVDEADTAEGAMLAEYDNIDDMCEVIVDDCDNSVGAMVSAEIFFPCKSV